MAWYRTDAKPLPELMITYHKFHPKQQTSIKYILIFCLRFVAPVTIIHEIMSVFAESYNHRQVHRYLASEIYVRFLLV